MADENKLKGVEAMATPLLLMPATGGLTLTPASGASLLMPVPQTESNMLLQDEVGEADSFIGQNSSINSAEPTSTNQYFQHAPALTPIDDPFTNIGKLPSTYESKESQEKFTPRVMTSTSQSGSQVPAGNQFRRTGQVRYATPPPSVGVSTIPPAGHASFPHTSSPYTGPPTLPTYQPEAVSTVPPHTMPPGHQPVSVDFNQQQKTYDVMGNEVNIGYSTPSSEAFYVPVAHHWFYCCNIEQRKIWKPFSVIDSLKLEDTFLSGEASNVSVQGGRYDVDVSLRLRCPVYWQDDATEVRRCSWFCRPEGETRFIPYEEDFAMKLEEEFRSALTNNVWHKKLEFAGGEVIVMHSPQVHVHYPPTSQPDEWGTSQGDQLRPRVVKRGVEEFEDIIEGESERIDHVVYVVHGIGSTCDLLFRNIVQCVDDFRELAGTILKSHFGMHLDSGGIGRVEFLPVKWHEALHGDATGIDSKLKSITLESIGKLRNYTNDTLLDILFYTSPKYCQKISDTVALEINRLHSLFKMRNPTFQGHASVAGHSLGSLILFDLLSHQEQTTAQQQQQLQQHTQPQQQHHMQSEIATEVLASAKQITSTRSASPGLQDNPKQEIELSQLLDSLRLTEYLNVFEKEHIDGETLLMCDDLDLKEMGIPLGPRKKIAAYIQKHKQMPKQVADNSKIHDYSSNSICSDEAPQINNTCVETSGDPILQPVSSHAVNYMVSNNGTGSILVNYSQLDIQPTHFFALGSPIAMFLTVRGVENLGEEFQMPTCPRFFNIFHPFDPVAYRMEPLVTPQIPPKPVLMPHHKGRKRLHLELKESLSRMGTELKQKIIDSVRSTWKSINDFATAHRTAVVQEEVETMIDRMKSVDEEMDSMSIASVQDEDILSGQLNQGRRIDYVLQEKPIESFNDYLFALGSHACYWESEDTILLILRELYSLQGVYPVMPGVNSSQPISGVNFSQSMPYINNLNSSGNYTQGPPPSVHHQQQFPPCEGLAAPPRHHGPPPLTGFIKQSHQ